MNDKTHTSNAQTSNRDRTQQNVNEATNQVKEKAQSVTQEAKERAGEMVDQARNEANSRVDQRTDQVAGRLNKVADSLRTVSNDLHEQDEEMFANYTDIAADQVSRFAGYVAERDGADLVKEVRRFADRQPEMFIGGALAAGFLLGRFMKSSQPSSQRSTEYSGGYSEDYRDRYSGPVGRDYGAYPSAIDRGSAYGGDYGRPGAQAQGVRAEQYGDVYGTMPSQSDPSRRQTHNEPGAPRTGGIPTTDNSSAGSSGSSGKSDSKSDYNESSHLGARESEVNRNNQSRTGLSGSSGNEETQTSRQSGKQPQSGEVPAQPGKERGVPQLGATKEEEWSNRETKDEPSGKTSDKQNDRGKDADKDKGGS